MPKLKSHEVLRVVSMRKVFDVTAWFATDDEANTYLKRNPDEGVIAAFSGLILIANVRGNPERLIGKPERDRFVGALKQAEAVMDCTTCNGKGIDKAADPCPDCHGNFAETMRWIREARALA